MRTGVRRLASVLLLLLLAMSACATSTHPLTPGSVGTKGASGPLVVWLGPAATLHPHHGNPHLTAALFSPLVVLDPTTRLPTWGPEVPGALVDAITSTDLRRWQMTIKDGWTWHDGAPVSAEDLARGWRAAIDTGLPVASTMFDIRVRDKTHVSFSLSAPYGQLPALLASPAFLPLPLQADADPEGFAAAPVGTGPFQLVNRSERLLELGPFDAAPGGRPDLATVRVSLADAPDPTDGLAVGLDGIDVASSELRTARLVAPGRQLAYLGFPLNDARYTDLAVREALSMALDRRQLIADVGIRDAVPADRVVGPGVARADGVNCTACSHDPDGARDRWPGDPDGPLTLWFAADAGHDDLINTIAGQWREVLGVQNIQLASLPVTDLLTRLREQQVTGPFRLTWNADLASPSRVLQPLFGDDGGANDFGFSSSPVGDAIHDADLTGDLSAATEAYAAAERLVLEDMPLIPLWFSVVTATASPDVDVAFNAAGTLDWTGLSSP